ncbi:MAG: hypothetical protein Q8K37_00135 [Alphaproteobacteria bacterium]|nr:hypothetical protein [Alphaproteobacteria bacterium]
MLKSTFLKVIPSLFKGSQDNIIPQSNEQYQEKLGTMTDQSSVKTIKHVIHSYNITHLRYKLRVADAILEQHKNKNNIVFCGRKRDKVLLDRFLGKLGYQIDVIDNYGHDHTNEQNDIKKVLIVSDGVDVSFLKGKIENVLHFDMPPKPSDYLTRLMMIFGTSEEDAKPCESHLIATMREFAALQILQQNYQFEIQEVKLEEFSSLNADVGFDPNAHEAQFYQNQHHQAPHLQNPFHQMPSYENNMAPNRQYPDKPYSREMPREISRDTHSQDIHSRDIQPTESFPRDISHKDNQLNDPYSRNAFPRVFEPIKDAEQKGFEEEPPAFFKKKT